MVLEPPALSVPCRYTERLESYTISVGDSLTSLSVCATGGAVDGTDVYAHACGATGRYMRLSVDNSGDLPFNLAEVDARLYPSAPSALVPMSSGIASATADPYRPDLFWWLGNCPATKCYDGDTGALATQNCGSNTTNLCHTGYVDQVHTLTYEFTASYYVEMVTIYNKPG